MALTHEELAGLMRQVLQTSLDEAPAFDPPPTLDLAVVAFAPGAAPAWANVLVTRGHHAGVVARIGADAGSVQDIEYLVDPTDAQRRSVAWQPGADWTRLDGLKTLHGHGLFRSIAPYPASLIKWMVAVGVGLAVDRHLTQWDETWTWRQRARSVLQWVDGMITESRNDDTSALVALLHARGIIQRGEQETRNDLHEVFTAWGLHTLRLANTRPDGGWLNRDGAGVGHLQMTAWDTVRLMWLTLSGWAPGVPAPPWRSGAQVPPPLLRPETAQRLWSVMDDQALHEVLSSAIGVGLPGWRAGMPAQIPPRWIGPDGRVRAADQTWPGDVRPLQARAQVRFAHKTGTTENYLSDAGWVRSLQAGGRHYLVALISTLGSRHAPHPQLACPGCVAAIGARLDEALARHWG